MLEGKYGFDLPFLYFSYSKIFSLVIISNLEYQVSNHTIRKFAALLICIPLLYLVCNEVVRHKARLPFVGFPRNLPKSATSPTAATTPPRSTANGLRNVLPVIWIPFWGVLMSRPFVWSAGSSNPTRGDLHTDTAIACASTP